MVPCKEPDAGEKVYEERQRPFQKLAGEYLFETVRMAMSVEESDRIDLIEPLSVKDFHNFMAKSYIILTAAITLSAPPLAAKRPPPAPRRQPAPPARSLRVLAAIASSLGCAACSLPSSSRLPRWQRRRQHPAGATG